MCPVRCVTYVSGRSRPVPFSWLGLDGLSPFDSGRRARLQPCRKMGLRNKGCRPWASAQGPRSAPAAPSAVPGERVETAGSSGVGALAQTLKLLGKSDSVDPGLQPRARTAPQAPSAVPGERVETAGSSGVGALAQTLKPLGKPDPLYTLASHPATPPPL